MRDAGAFVLFWATLLAAAAVGLWIDSAPDAIAPSLLSGAAAVAALVGAWMVARPPGLERVRAVPELSPPTLAVVGGATALALAVPFGIWLALIGAGLVALGGVGIARELLATRREGE